MAVHLALIYHIHNFLGARDKPLRAALIKNKAQTLIHSQENKHLYLNRHNALHQAAQNPPYMHIPCRLPNLR